MMLEHVGEIEKARRIRAAIAAVVKEGKVRTYDMMRIPGGAKAISQGAASTGQMTDAVLAKLAQQMNSADGSNAQGELAEVGRK
jgi:3-isopropylmalate dehydrogenase